MIHPESVSPALFSTLVKLYQIDELKNAALGGGTSLALRFGHRKSIDIDLFFTKPFNSLLVQESLMYHFDQFSVTNRTPGSLSGNLDTVKLDILLHSYPLLNKYTHEEELVLVSLPDMAAMKINAVTNRGSKKDFSDLLLLHENGIPLPQALEFFCNKYGSTGRFLAIRSLNWFDDAEAEPDPIYLNGWTWTYVQQQMATLGQSLIH